MPLKNFKGTPGVYKIDPNPATHILGLKTIEISSIRSENDLPEWIAYVRGKNNEEAFATAKLFAASKDMAEALQELLRFRHFMEEAAHTLQYPDNYENAIAACALALVKALD